MTRDWTTQAYALAYARWLTPVHHSGRLHMINPNTGDAACDPKLPLSDPPHDPLTSRVCRRPGCQKRLRDLYDEPPGAGVPCECGSFLHSRCRPAS